MTIKVPVVTPKSKAKIERDAHKLLLKLQPEALVKSCEVDVEIIFELDLPGIVPGLRTGYADLSHLGSNIMGFTDTQEKVSFVHKDLYEAEDTVTRRRFRATVAHEIAHCIYHLPVLNFRSLSSGGADLYRMDRKKIKPYEDPEWQAWKYAGAILMPKERIQGLVDKGWSEYEVADDFNVNPAFVKARLGALKK